VWLCFPSPADTRSDTTACSDNSQFDVARLENAPSTLAYLLYAVEACRICIATTGAARQHATDEAKPLAPACGHCAAKHSNRTRARYRLPRGTSCVRAGRRRLDTAAQ